MEEVHSNGRSAFQWKKCIPMEEENSMEEWQRKPWKRTGRYGYGNHRHRPGDDEQPGGLLEGRQAGVDSLWGRGGALPQRGRVCGRGGISARGGGKGAAADPPVRHGGFFQVLYGHGKGVQAGRQDVHPNGAVGHGAGAAEEECPAPAPGGDWGGHRDGSGLF